MNDPILDWRVQQAKSSLDDALGVAQRVQQRMGAMPLPGAPMLTGQSQQPHPPTAPQPFGAPQQQMAPVQPPMAWPSMPGANPLLQQLASQYTAQQAQVPQMPAPQAKPFARGGLAVFG